MDNNQSDLHLIYLIKEDDSKALDSLFRKYYSSLCQFAAQLSKRDDIAQEIVADVFVRLWEKRKTLNLQYHVRSYLYKATRYTAINYIHHELKEFEELDDNTQEETYTPLDALMFQELEIYVASRINQLPEKRRIIFQLNRFEGFTYSEIADILNISVKTVENQMGHALKQLRVLFNRVEQSMN
ncbi:RNA polymerase sigma-70 factor [Spirosoma radiotolerans]|uniref:ECF subfamily RNA polymerase sigma-24 subunit n=1 Tax=Spirosoma radiotolerans TaxID=1379870 RepID=A0A0E4A0N3_9BACT|nr:RNA polymerase sigma-70 factor [Spirosoma radiotolerans]AKD58222.1 ECF subfamily RNA polymerase sigma-24 subunit [Spirosoma radiotolerans]